MHKQFNLLSIIIPVYNEESTVGEVIERILKVELPIAKEIIVIDDGSNDSTPARLRDNLTNITHLHLNPVNIGKGAAIRIGLSFAKGDIILLQDADLELNPNEYLNLLQPIFEGTSSVVYGSRFLKNNNRVTFSRRIANRALTMVTNLIYHSGLTDMETAYKVFTTEAAKKLDLRANRFEIEPEITARICQAGYRIREVPISYCPRTASEGKKINWQDGIKALLTLFRCRFDNRQAKTIKYDEPTKQQ
ncbi:MAG: glycosyltransferase family 2 protein [Pyrinomonadaceae bacterium]|nr:glycosyltransferase family 2 protein [Pyrinomonadaceae bacterium]